MWRNNHAIISHAGELYSAKRANVGVRVFAIYSHAYENESTFWHEWNLDQSWFDLSKCNSKFSLIYGSRKSANFLSKLI